MLVNMKCSSCGATMQFDDTKESMDCPYCGSKVANLAEQVNISQNVNVSGTVVHVQDRSNEPNLYISYNTNNQGVGLVFRIVSNGVKGALVNGQTVSYHLNQGPHTIVLKIGKKNYNRNIVIPADNQPVRIYCAFNGRGQITVDQPNVSAPQNAAGSGSVSAPQMQAPKPAGLPKSPLSILAFILSLTMYLSWAGAGLGAVDIFVLDKKKEKNHTFSYVAMGIGAFLTICLIISLAKGPKDKTTETTVPAAVETTIEETQATTTTTTTISTTATETTSELEETDEEVDEDVEDTKDSDSDGVTPELKEYLDSYEAFMDEYIEFLVRYTENPSDITLIAEYAEMQIKYAEFVQAIDEYDQDEMSDADLAYYIEVTTRVSAKLTEASLTIAET